MSGPEQTAARRARVADIVAIAASMSGLAAANILGTSRLRKYARVRQACYYVARRAGHSFPAIGKLLKRDHSTIIDGYREVERLIACRADFAQFVSELETRALAVEREAPVSERITAAIPDRIEPLVCIERLPTQRARNDFRSDEQPDSWLMPGDDMIVGSAALAAAVLRERNRFQQGEQK